VGDAELIVRQQLIRFEPISIDSVEVNQLRAVRLLLVDPPVLAVVTVFLRAVGIDRLECKRSHLIIYYSIVDNEK